MLKVYGYKYSKKGSVTFSNFLVGAPLAAPWAGQAQPLQNCSPPAYRLQLQGAKPWFVKERGGEAPFARVAPFDPSTLLRTG